jgi:hypothetical protein
VRLTCSSTGGAVVAAQRADEMLDGDDLEGQVIWKRVPAAIEEWKRAKVLDSDAVN